VEFAGINLDTLKWDSIGTWPKLLRSVVLGVVCVLTLILGYVFQLSDLTDQLNNLFDKLEKSKETFVDTQQKVSNLESYRKEVKVIEDELSKATEQLPQNSEQAGLLEDISQQASTSGLQFVAIKPKGQISKGFYQEGPMELTLSGEYDGLAEFSSNVANMSRIVTLHDFVIKKNNTTGKGSLMMTVQARTYWTSEGH